MSWKYENEPLKFNLTLHGSSAIFGGLAVAWYLGHVSWVFPVCAFVICAISGGPSVTWSKRF